MNTRSCENLRRFLQSITRLVERTAEEKALLETGTRLMQTLIAHDDWLPEALAQPDATYYRQYLLYGDPLDRFSLVSFVWGPGQRTPIHDHTVWGIIGVLRGAEMSQRFRITETGPMPHGAPERLEARDIAIVSPTVGDVHEVRNAYDDRVSISIHLYGGNIGRIARHVFDPASGRTKRFTSGYSNEMMPNPWWQPPAMPSSAPA
ncbi:MAG TPA: cysteine dioxygenase [Burkholderiales bacterium]|nr:cysteine dioxygenase [Burkholderiales bacterium]